MFDKLKDMYKLRQEAQEMQKKLGSHNVTGISKSGLLHITLNGNQEITHVEVKNQDDLIKSGIEKNIREAFTDAQAKLKSVLMESFKGMF